MINMDRKDFLKQILTLGAELEKTDDLFKILTIINDAEILHDKYVDQLKKND